MGERLSREQIVDLRSFYLGRDSIALADTALALMDENERLRTALSRIFNVIETSPNDSFLRCEESRSIALAALAAVGDTEESCAACAGIGRVNYGDEDWTACPSCAGGDTGEGP